MVEHHHNDGRSPNNPDDDIFARVAQLTECRLRITEDLLLGCINVDVLGLMPGVSVVMAPSHALDAALRLTQACARLSKAQREEAKGPPNLGPGSFSGSY